MSENYIIGNNFFLLGNSFDLVLNLLIKLDSDFKILTPPPTKHNLANFIDLYQSHENDIWGGFENLLGCPDF